MADDKRRRARVQAKWAESPTKPPMKPPQSPSGVHASACFVHKHAKGGPDYVFEDAKQVCKKKPSDIFIDKEGNHILSHTPENDTCSIQFYPKFIDDEEEKSQLFDVLLRKIPWQEKHCVINGQRMKMPRLVAWYGPLAYRFSGATLPSVDKWPAVIDHLHNRIKSALGYEFNSVLLNLYEDGKSSVAWHSDDELIHGIHSVIASLSFGETRMFELREKAPDGDYDNAQHVKIPLTDGSLLIMEGETQTYWQHRIPKEFHDRKPRINLTFRTVFNKD